MRGFNLLILCFSLFISYCSQAQDKVFWMKIEGEIDPRTTRYVKIALQRATELKSTAIIAEVNTFGGSLDDADKIRTALLECKVPVYAFINKNAASAGALISIACDSIYMASGSNIGAATVVLGGTGEAAPDKYQSYMRSIMRSTAETNHRNPQIAEAMVDQNLKLDTAIKKDGQVITFTTSEAIKYHYCEAQVSEIEEILVLTGHKNAILEKHKPDWYESVISYFLNPALSSILILLIIGGIYYELQAPGLGFPIVVSILAALLYFIPYYLSGLAQNWEILLFFIGLVLIGVEIFVIPGFGVVGILGIAVVVMSLFLVMINNNYFDFTFVPEKAMIQAGVTAMLSIFGLIGLLFWGLSHLATSKRMSRISLQHTFKSGSGYSVSSKNDLLVGKIGIVLTELRPIGKVEIEGEVYSAISSVSFLEIGTHVEIIGQEINNLKVRRV